MEMIKKEDAIKALKRWFHGKGWMLSNEDVEAILWDIPSVEPNLIMPEKMERGEYYQVGETIAVMNQDDYMDMMCKAMMWDEYGESNKGEWIPCSERLPEKAGHYLCSFKNANRIDNIYVDLAYWTGGRWYGYLANEINAWMPLPKPWKGTDDE